MTATDVMGLAAGVLVVALLAALARGRFIARREGPSTPDASVRSTPAFWAAGVDTRDIVTRADRAIYTSMGTMVFLTAVVAAVAMFFALVSALNLSGSAVVAPAVAAVLWGSLVLTIDRWIVSSYDHGPVEEGEFAPRGFAAFRDGVRRVAGYLGRVAMAAVIGVLIAEPVTFALFAPEIRAQMADDLVARVQAAQARVNEQYDAKNTDPGGKVAAATAVFDAAANDNVLANQVFNCEDHPTSACVAALEPGTVSGVEGFGPKATRALAARDAADAALLAARTELEDARLEQAAVVAGIEEDRSVALKRAENAETVGQGILAREEALAAITGRNAHLATARWTVFAALLLVDLMPLLLRAMAGKTNYSRLQRARAIEKLRHANAEAILNADARWAVARHCGDTRVAEENYAFDADAALDRVIADADRSRRAERAGCGGTTGVREAVREDVRGQWSEPAPGTAHEDTPDLTVASTVDRRSPATEPDGMVVGGRWRLVGPLRVHSAQTIPYVAVDQYGQYPRAVVKIIAKPPEPGDPDTDHRRRFKELSITTGTIDDNLAELLDADLDPVFGYYVVTPLYPTTVADWLRDPENHPDLTLGLVLDWVRQIVGGIVAAWNHEYVHLDLKPANFGLTEDGTLKIFDFGLVQYWRSQGSGQTTTTPKYTAFYAPPEQMRRSPNWITRAADVRALGACAYRMLTGAAPLLREAVALGLVEPDGAHVGDTAVVQIKDLVSTFDATPIRVMLPGVPTYVADLIVQWLSRDPGARNPGDQDGFARRMVLMVDAVIARVEADDLAGMRVGPTVTIEPELSGVVSAWRQQGRRSWSQPTEPMPAEGYSDGPTVIPGASDQTPAPLSDWSFGTLDDDRPTRTGADDSTVVDS